MENIISFGKIINSFFFTFSSIFLYVLMMSSCSSLKNADSKWRDNEIKIDGNSDDWNSSLMYFDDEKIMLGVRNDNDNLYICVKTGEPSTIRKIMRMGLTIWLNDKSNDSKSFGINYPTGMLGNRMNFMPKEIENDSSFNQNRQKKQEQNLGEKMDIMLTSINFIIDESGEKKISSIENAEKKYNIHAAVKYSEDLFTYEISIPLFADSDLIKLHKQNVSDNDNKISIGIETGEMKKSDNQENSPRGGFRDGGGDGGIPGGVGGPSIGGVGGGMGRGGMRGGRGGNFNRNREEKQNNSEPIKIWLNVQLAKK